MIYTAQQFIASPAFVEIATEEALKLIAKTNNQPFDLAVLALALKTPNVVSQVAELVAKAAQHAADEANAGRLWG